MEAVLLLDQRLSRRDSDRVEGWRAEANRRYSEQLTLPFVRTTGDEMQALTGDPDAFVGIVMDAVEDGGWWVGAGLGDVEQPLGETTRESRGEPFWLAREALVKAKSQRATRPFAVRGEGVGVKELNACLDALAFVVLRRTAGQANVAGAFRSGLTVAQIAKRRSVTVQAVYAVLQAAGAEEEAGLRKVAITLASRALGSPSTS